MTADREQVAYRSYRLQRLLPPMVACFSDTDLNAGGMRLTLHSVKRNLEVCPTSTLEGRLEEFYEGLLEVRTAIVLQTSGQAQESFNCIYTEL